MQLGWEYVPWGVERQARQLALELSSFKEGLPGQLPIEEILPILLEYLLTISVMQGVLNARSWSSKLLKHSRHWKF